MRRGESPGSLFLTGPPGSGKTTLIREASEILREGGCRVKGFYAPEIREGGRRVGFDICDLECTMRTPLARIDCLSTVKVGRYGVCIEQAARAALILRDALKTGDVIVIDEIGPMELLVPEIREAIIEVLSSKKPVLGVVHRRLKSKYPNIYSLVRQKGPILWLDRESRPIVRRKVLDYVRVLAVEVCGAEGGESSSNDSRSGGS
ncbi:MAG: NTPase [Desulfurococcales archaeon]|nr:NTPase [Desulfurococcales archaeon]